MRCLFFFFTLLSSYSSLAYVNAYNGSFIDHWYDFPLGRDLMFHRSYNSRTLHQGWFGLGWCSIFESRIFKREEALAFSTCEHSEVLLYPTPHNPTIYHGGHWSLARLRHHFVLRNDHGDLLRFDKHGRLIQINSRKSPEMHLKYDKSKIQISVQNGLRYNFEFQGSKLRRVTRNRQTVAEYFYQNGLLKIAKNAWQNSYEYIYNETQNLVALYYPDGSQKLIHYDSAKDRVQTILHRNFCYETYEYKAALPPYSRGHTVIARQKCPHKEEKTTRLSFVYAKQNLAYFEKSENGELVQRAYYE